MFPKPLPDTLAPLHSCKGSDRRFSACPLPGKIAPRAHSARDLHQVGLMILKVGVHKCSKLRGRTMTHLFNERVRRLHLKALLPAVTFALSACNPWVRRSEAEALASAEAHDAAAEAVAPLASRVEELESKIEDLESESRATKESVSSVDSLASSLSQTVARNARISNENAAKDMTLRGACGTEYIQLTNGSWGIHNKTCTVADLK